MTHTAVRRPTHWEVSAERDRQPDLRWWCLECGAVFCLAAARAVRFTCAATSWWCLMAREHEASKRQALSKKTRFEVFKPSLDGGDA